MSVIIFDNNIRGVHLSMLEFCPLILDHNF